VSDSLIEELKNKAANFNVRNGLSMHGVPAEIVPLVWPIVRKMLLSAIDHAESDLSESTVYRDLLARNSQLWLACVYEVLRWKKPVGWPVAAGVTQILVRDKRKVCQLFLIGGKGLAAFMDFEDVLTEWARFHNCTELEGNDGRNGAWLRVLKRRGWRASYTVIRKVI
jgi:hypothetical protein